MGRENKSCFTDSQGNALFTIPDGGIIKLAYGNCDENYAICRYLDETHAKIDGVDYSILEFAQIMVRNGTCYAAA